MIQKKNLQNALGLSMVFMLVCLLIGTSCAAAQLSPTSLEITAVKGGFGKASVTVKNIGNSTAENITMTISVQGGMLKKINVTKICSGCGNCSNSIDPNATKTESTSGAGNILGFGPIVIAASVEASNAEKVEKTFNGFVFGPFVLITS
jgi:hypothetical protein